MHISVTKCRKLVEAIAPSGNLFLLLLLQELRRQGMTFLGFYVLQRAIEETNISEFQLRRETGLENYEISRACKFLSASHLIKLGRSPDDRRVRIVTSIDRGRKVHNDVLSAAARQLQRGLSIDNGFAGTGENRKLDQARSFLHAGNRKLLGPLQLSFFDTNPKEMEI
jgi:DNA-binding MarR family transcriptional regulator